MTNVLVAEDNPVNRELLRELLEAWGYRVIEAFDGQEALRMIEQNHPEILLLDNPLGGMDLRHMMWWLDFLDQLSSGGGLLQGRKMTLVATGEDLRPWQNRAGNFAVLKQGRLMTLGRRNVLAGHSEPLVRELLAEGFGGG